MIIRDEIPADADAVRAVITAAFAGKPYSDGSEPAVMDRLRAAGAATVALVAEQAGEVVGQVAFSPVTVDGRQSVWHCLGPVAVRPDLQGSGIGSALIIAGLDRLRHLGSVGCVLLGDPGYYRRFGFRTGTAMTAPGYPAEYFMVLPFGAETPAACVGFHPAFGAPG
ncbi:MAG TPA: N-acetyltransferase [Thalassobaculum sp.]